MPEQTVTKSSPAAIAFAWIIVLIPTAWGLTHTVENALKIFSTAPPASTQAPPAR